MRSPWLLLPLLALATGCWTRLGQPDAFEAGSRWEPPVHLAASATPPPAAEQALPDVLDLDAAVRIALEENPSLRTAFMRVEAAKARLTSSWTVYSPVIDGVALYSKTFQVPRQRSVPGINQETEFYRYGLRGTWLLFDGLAREYRVRAAEFGVTESKAVHDDARRLLRQAVEAAYFAALGAVEGVRIAEADLAFEKELLDETAKRHRAGDRSLSDKLNFEVRVRTAESNLIAVQSRLRTLRVALAELLGIENGRLPERVQVDILEVETEEDLAEPVADALVREALENRPDLGGAVAAADRRRAEVGATDSGWWPALALVGEIGRERFGNAHFRSEDTASSVSLQATWNLFSGGSRLAAHREAVANQRAAEAELAQVRNQVISEVRQAVEAVLAAQQQVVTQREKVKLTRETRDLVRKEYDAGHESLVRLNEVQRDFVVAEARLASERVALRTARSGLRTAVGR